MNKHLCLIILSLFFAGTISAKGESEKNIDEKYSETSKYLDVFNTLFVQLNKHYVDSIPVDKIVTAGINGMLEELDPYTTYIAEENDKNFKFMTTGEYGGVGSLISIKNDSVYISEVYENMPAQKAGLKAGDIFLEIDGEDLNGKSTSDVSNILRGIPGTEVEIKIQRPGTKKPIKIDITRQNIYLNPVAYYGIIATTVGYIRLSSFTDNCAAEVKKSFFDLKNQGIKSLVLDFRGNPGGLLNEATDLANLFLPQGKTVVTTKGKNGVVDQVYKTSVEPIDTKIPLVVMTDGGSASASEIVAGALQDYDRAVVIGGRTFGKGLVQGTYPVAYDGKLKVTTAKYYIPSGRCIQAIKYDVNDDKKATEIPDSLTTEFKTKNGRIVRDGRGISPDIKIETESFKTVTFSLMAKSIIFDYVTEYCLKHTKIAPIDKFVYTDKEFEGFKKFVLAKDFTYELVTENKLKKLIEIAKQEGYYDDNKAEFDALEKALQHDIERDLDMAKKEIKEYISYEIVKRFYYQKGEIIEILKNDSVAIKSIEVLNDSVKYNSILNPTASQEK